MKKYFLWSAACLVAAIAVLFVLVSVFDTKTRPAPQVPVGYNVTEFTVPHRDTSLALHLWYPTAADTAQQVFGQNALFYGFHAIADAAPAPEAAPLVVLSHGSGGNAAQLGWIASELARTGMIVAATNHPGTTSRDSLPERTVMIWERSKDVSAMLDNLLSAPPLGLKIDPARIGAMGFSLGGFTALSVAGETVSKAQFIDYCDRNAGLVDCGWMQQAGVDFSAIDQTLYEASYKDTRITAAVAVDPALPQAVPPAGTHDIDIPVLVVNLGAPDTIPQAMRADALADRIQGANYIALEGGHHFSFLPECSPMGVVVIGVAGDDNICSDRGYRPRAQMHQGAKDVIVPFFLAHFGI